MPQSLHPILNAKAEIPGRDRLREREAEPRKCALSGGGEAKAADSAV